MNLRDTSITERKDGPMNKYKVAVLGCGPSGLLAVHACHRVGIKPDIYSVKRKSPTGGAMYLHEAIPGLTSEEPETYVTFRRKGDAETYARKVYGTPAMEHSVSFLRYGDGEQAPAWDLVTAYELLWDAHGESVIDGELGAWSLEPIMEEYDLVISSLPARVMCVKSDLHQFPSAPIWIANENLLGLPDDTIMYNGGEESWYRSSVIFGRPSVEWGRATSLPKPPVPGVIKVGKPIVTNCDCWTDRERFLRVGRFGRWDKWALSHDGFVRTEKALATIAERNRLALFGLREQDQAGRRD